MFKDGSRKTEGALLVVPGIQFERKTLEWQFFDSRLIFKMKLFLVLTYDCLQFVSVSVSICRRSTSFNLF